MAEVRRDRLGNREARALRRSTRPGERLRERLVAHNEAGIRRCAGSWSTWASSGWRSSAPTDPGRAPARGRAHGDRRPPQPGQGRPRALLGGARQVRPLRRLRARRAGPHRRPPAAGDPPRRRRDQGAAGADADPRGPGRTPVELANQLRAQLEAFWPGALIFAESTRRSRSPSSPATRARPTPRGSAPGASALPRPPRLLGRPRPRGAARADAPAPAGRAGEAEAGARRAAVLGLVAALGRSWPRSASSPRRSARRSPPTPTRRSSAPLFRDPQDGDLPGDPDRRDRRPRERYPSEAALAADAGMSPVAVESGKRRLASFRRACDKRLRDTWSTLADSTRKWHPWAREVYADAIARGQDHPHAIRILGRAWTRVLWRCWQDGVPYDPAKHGNLSGFKPRGVDTGRLIASPPRPPGAAAPACCGTAGQVARRRRGRR